MIIRANVTPKAGQGYHDVRPLRMKRKVPHLEKEKKKKLKKLSRSTHCFHLQMNQHPIICTSKAVLVAWLGSHQPKSVCVGGLHWLLGFIISCHGNRCTTNITQDVFCGVRTGMPRQKDGPWKEANTAENLMPGTTRAAVDHQEWQNSRVHLHWDLYSFHTELPPCAKWTQPHLQVLGSCTHRIMEVEGVS